MRTNYTIRVWRKVDGHECWQFWTEFSTNDLGQLEDQLLSSKGAIYNTGIYKVQIMDNVNDWSKVYIKSYKL